MEGATRALTAWSWKAVYPGQDDASVRQYGGMGRLVGDADVLRSGPGLPAVGTDAAVDVQVGFGFGIVRPRESPRFYRPAPRQLAGPS